MTPAQKAVASAAICDKVLHLEVYQRAHVVMMFVSLPDEPAIEPLARHTLATGKTLVVPRPNWADCTMTAALVQDWPGDLIRDHKEFLAPRDDAPAFDPSSIHCVLIPGLAFTQAGARLGRGGGFYDRYLPQIALDRRVGVCFACQVVDHLPQRPHDEFVAQVVSA
jgi:5-formyltetrahydrofolate cyclo-ligase